MIKLYCVGIHFKKPIDFKADPKTPGFMTGEAILQAAADLGLRYSLNPGNGDKHPEKDPTKGHIEWLSYTPVKSDPPPRTTFGVPFPLFGIPLTLIQRINAISEVSQVFQYTVSAIKPFDAPPRTQKYTGQAEENGGPTREDYFKHGDAQFGQNGFPDNCEIRIRLLSIYCTRQI